MTNSIRRMGTGAAALLWLAGLWCAPAGAQSISGRAFTTSSWRENLVAPPGNHDGQGSLVIGVWPAGVTEVGGVPVSGVTLTSGSLPLAYGPYSFSLPGPFSNGSYQVVAWIDGNQDGAYDLGEPHVVGSASIADGASAAGLNLVITDDSNGNNLPDWWEYHWFRNTPKPFGQGGGDDPDGDGLSNEREAAISAAGLGMDEIDPANWDSDGDGMDDKWEYDYFSTEYLIGMNPTVGNHTNDFDGDGLTDWQEYCGVDGRPRMKSGGIVNGIRVGVSDAASDDSLNPLDIDTDFDMLIDSFEAAWYDPANGIDPRQGVISDFTGAIDTTIARADPDQDGLANYREQCLLAEFREGGANQDKWLWETRIPFPFLDYVTDDGAGRRICLMAVPLKLGVNVAKTIPSLENRNALRNHEWTDPTDGTGYTYADEDLPAGHDTDDDWLPDGWEVMFHLDPRNDGLSGTNWDNGPFGDPDNDSLYNIEEYLGQDGNRSVTLPYINGTGDETNPNEHNCRPDSTGKWLWYPMDPLYSALTDPRKPLGINRSETVGSALPTATKGRDSGQDSDDDGIPDADEVHPGTGILPSSPVHSCDPYLPKSVRITSAQGIVIPDPEPEPGTNMTPAGVREDLQRREWTVECQVKLLGTNLTGSLFDFRTRVGPASRIVYRLALSNNVPSLAAHVDNVLMSVTANALPTNRWLHLAGVWNRKDNTLGLYVDGVLFMGTTVHGENWSELMLPATNALALAVSADGSFVNRLLLDEVRIWGVARSRDQIAAFARRLAPIANGDDVWIDAQSPQYYSFSDTVLVDGGSLFDGEPGVLLSNVCANGGTSYWIDDGDHQYNAARDTLLVHGSNLVEGTLGTLVANVRWNDKDGSGAYSRDSLLAYYRFDDGGTTAEDFARRAKTDLIGAVRPEFAFGDRGYALPTNHFAWVTDDAAPVYGADARGSDDSDNDGLPDAWETINGLDAYDDGAGQESAAGTKDGPFGAHGDPDHDGLNNLYEYWAGTNPREADSNGDGIPDAQEDRDGDGVANATEQTLGTRPDMADTDDDGLTDGEEQEMGTNPADSSDPAVSRAVALGGAPSDYVEIPSDASQALTDWTLEAWVQPSNTASGAGYVVRRVVENLAGGRQAMNYVMGIETNAGGLRLYAGYVLPGGGNRLLYGGLVPAGQWTHVAATYSSVRATLTLYTNGVKTASTSAFSDAPPLNGKGGEAYVRVGEDFGGQVDEVRVWNTARTPEAIAAAKDSLLAPSAMAGLVDYIAFDDGEANTHVFPWGAYHKSGGLQDYVYPADWNNQWRHAARRHGHASLVEPGAIVPPQPPVLQVAIDGPASAQWSLDGLNWLDSGATSLVSGTYYVYFSTNVLGWKLQQPETNPLKVTLANGQVVQVDGVYTQAAQSVRGNVYDGSTWLDQLPASPGAPGDGDGEGQLLVGLWSAGAPLASVPLSVQALDTPDPVLPFPAGPYSYTLVAPQPGSFQVVAWVDGNMNGLYDGGEPHAVLAVAIGASDALSGKDLTVTDDANGDTLPDWWQYHWFPIAPFDQGPGVDSDGDGLDNATELKISQTIPGFDSLNPANWDTDGDGMDDGWEYKYYSKRYGLGMNPCVYNAGSDFDGDGLSDWQEYCGVDRIPVMELDQVKDGIVIGKRNNTDDALNPLDIDTDFDLLIDSFEAAWYDPANGIDPASGASSVLPAGTNVDASIAMADPDHDGLSNYREQCLLTNLWQESGNSDKWVWANRVPFPQLDYYADDGQTQIRICLMDFSGEPLDLGLVMELPLAASTNRYMLRHHGWTDPTEGTGYDYVDEAIPPGHDTDADGLPDGWEVEFNLDPQDATGDNGAFGDPDGDGLMNIEEYLGQDGERSVTLPYLNGTGDETNPFEHNWRPDSTYKWRWYAPALLGTAITDPRHGTGISRDETLGSALPTKSLGVDLGKDSDDDGIPDNMEIHPAAGELPSCPVLSCDPFIPRAVLITSSNGIPIPDPEPVSTQDAGSGGMRADLQRRDWTIECQVKLLGTNLNGTLFDFETSDGIHSRIAYRLALSNNAPVLTSHNSAGTLYTVAANALATNRWTHLAGVWSHAANSLGLYIDGLLVMEVNVLGECPSGLMHPATNRLALAASPDGSFVNRLMLDEVRIWGVARTRDQIAQFANRLVSQANGDDVWIDRESPQYYRGSDTVIVNGGSLFDGEPGAALSNVFSSAGNFWIDDGDGQYNAARDVLLARDTTLAEGLVGSGVGKVLWNDKDGSGGFSRDSLLAYYRFDDGGTTAEDFARKAKNGLLGAAREEYLFGDFGYALSNGFQWVTNGAAPVYGVDERGADDSDHDGLPDGWEIIHHLDPWDDGTHGESLAGAKDGRNGAKGDPDGDGLNNRYEFWAGTNPQAADSDGNGIPDAQEDRDGDGVVNVAEQELGSRPDLADTDDDGLTDNEERQAGTGPANALDPAVSRAVILGGSTNDFFDVPLDAGQRLSDWTLEAWVWPSNAVVGAGTIVRRVVETFPSGGQALNYIMGLETNAVGELRPYAGYVRTDGTSYFVRGGTVPVGGAGWTHVAATYNSLNSTLSLYTNGALVAVTNTPYNPPVTGRGGDTFVRLGEGLGGGLDEVRIWNRVRTAEEIVAARSFVISGTATNGLVHDFRFDDSQANTLVLPFGPFHQPNGYQDFTASRDWENRWRHALRVHGAIAEVIPGAIVPPPSLRVILQPPSVVAAGAQWMVDGREWVDSGGNVQGLTPGSHVVTYKPVDGWTKPASSVVVLTNGVSTTLTALYLKNASVRINLLPDGALDGGARWRVDNGDWMSSGSVVSNLSPGVHVIDFISVAGYVTPLALIPTLAPDETYERTVEYAEITGALRALILPTGATNDGARWRFNSGGWLEGGVTVSNLPLGNYIVEFGPAPRWIAPSPVQLTLDSADLVVVTGVYSQVTGISADIVPASARTAGAKWRIGSGTWNDSGAVVEVAPGTYTVSFKPLDGWLAPSDMSVVVVTQQVTTVAGVYYVIDLLGGVVGTEPGQLNRPCGLAIDSLHRLYVADTYNDRIQRYDPMDRSWTVWGHYGTNVAEFFRPYGVAVDDRFNVYVADANNDRIQIRAASNGQWRVQGMRGTNTGQFSGPADLVLDSARNLYVADLYNHRVQKCSTSGVWSVFVTNGTGLGRTQFPRGLLMDDQDRLLLADDGTLSNGQSRIQRFTATGQFVDQLGSRVTAEGGLRRPAGMAIAGTNLYLADIDNSRVAVSPMTNQLWTTLVGGGVLSNAEDVVYDRRGILYIADSLHHRILALPLVEGALTNGQATFTTAALPGTNGFLITWFGTTNWLYAVQFAGSIVPPPTWAVLPGASNIPGRNALTNYVDRSAAGATNRFYRVLAY